MTYATSQDMVVRFGEREITQLADRNLDGTNDPEVVGKALASASSEIDSYLAVRYSVPVMSVSDNLNRVCCDIARYLMHENAAIEEVESRYKRAVAWLKDISTGKALLTDENGKTIDANGDQASVGVRYFASKRQFTDEKMSGF